MNDPEVDVSVTHRTKLSRSKPNSVIIIVKTKSEEIFVNQTTGQYQTRGSTRLLPPFLININLRSSSHHHIRTLLHDRSASYRWFNFLCDTLVPVISRAAINLSFGYNGFNLTMEATVTNKTNICAMNDEKSLRIVLLGRMKAEELKNLNIETESCSICLENLSGPKPSDLTLMTCSHVFHNCCLLEWLKRKNTCPLCRTVLYDQ